MMRSKSHLSVATCLVLACRQAEAFRIQLPPRAGLPNSAPTTSFCNVQKTALHANNADDGSVNDDAARTPFNAEKASQEGADAIQQLSVAERTRRAMMAEAVEDRMLELEDELENMILQTNANVTQEALGLATQIKTLQQDYTDLVMGQESKWLASEL